IGAASPVAWTNSRLFVSPAMIAPPFVRFGPFNIVVATSPVRHFAGREVEDEGDALGITESARARPRQCGRVYGEGLVVCLNDAGKLKPTGPCCPFDAP